LEISSSSGGKIIAMSETVQYEDYGAVLPRPAGTKVITIMMPKITKTIIDPRVMLSRSVIKTYETARPADAHPFLINQNISVKTAATKRTRNSSIAIHSTVISDILTSQAS